MSDTSIPAFPAEVGFGTEYIQTGPSTALYYGMTLRDYFAAQIVVGLLARTNYMIDYKNLGSVTKTAYEVADAMLKTREATR